MPTSNLEATIPASLKAAVDPEALRARSTSSAIVTAALSQYPDFSLHTLFQISTSGALVAGVCDGEVTVDSILKHGDFGLGTFANLDGEMVVLDGRVYQVQGNGRVSEADRKASAPFAVVTRFSRQKNAEIGPVAGFNELEHLCDEYRTSGNIFYAMRLDGHFVQIRTRAVNPPPGGTRLADAAKAQSEFRFADIDGTLVGLWSPGFSSAFSIPSACTSITATTTSYSRWFGKIASTNWPYSSNPSRARSDRPERCSRLANLRKSRASEVSSLADELSYVFSTGVIDA